MQFNDFLLPTRKLKVILKFKEIIVDKINFAARLYSAVYIAILKVSMYLSKPIKIVL